MSAAYDDYTMRRQRFGFWFSAFATAARVYLRKAGSPSGVVMRMPDAWSELVDKAGAKFGITCAKFHLQTGDELEEDGLCLLAPGEVIYVSDDSRLSPQLSPAPPIAANHLQPVPSFLDLSNESVQSQLRVGNRDIPWVHCDTNDTRSTKDSFA